MKILIIDVSINLGAQSKELFNIMKATGMLSLYDKFQEAGITAAVIWNLSEDILDDTLKLTKIEKLIYTTAQKKQQNELLSK